MDHDKVFALKIIAKILPKILRFCIFEFKFILKNSKVNQSKEIKIIGYFWSLLCNILSRKFKPNKIN